MEWSDEDMNYLQNTILLFKSVEKTHPNLGIPLIFAKLIDFSNLGLFIIAPRGRGKTYGVIYPLEQIRHRTVLKISTITPMGLEKIEDILDNNQVTILNGDFSGFYTSYLKEVGVNIISQLIYDHNASIKTGRYTLEIKNCYISFISGMQPVLYKGISWMPNFEAMYKDRFIRFFLFYPFGKPEEFTRGQPLLPQLNISIEKMDDIKISERVLGTNEYRLIVSEMKWHTSPGRGREYVNRLLKASAWLNNRSVVELADLKFISMCMPYILIEKWFSKRTDPASPLKFDANAYVLLEWMLFEGRLEAKFPEIIQSFQIRGRKVSKRSLERWVELPVVTGVFDYMRNTVSLNKSWYIYYIQPIKQFKLMVG